MDNRDPVREFLNSVLESRIEVKRIERKLKVLEARVLNITSQLTGMPSGGAADRNAVLAAYSDISQDYYARLAEAERKEMAVAEFIDQLPTSDSRIILRLHYLDCKKWPKVLAALRAAGRDIEERQMYRLHGVALNEARELYKEIYHDKNRDT